MDLTLKTCSFFSIDIFYFFRFTIFSSTSKPTCKFFLCIISLLLISFLFSSLLLLIFFFLFFVSDTALWDWRRDFFKIITNMAGLRKIRADRPSTAAIGRGTFIVRSPVLTVVYCTLLCCTDCTALYSI